VDHPLNLPSLNIPKLLRQYGVKPDKRLGQNFLLDEQTILKIIKVAQLTPDDQVLEIGAGVGNLTRYLAAASGTVKAIEIDHRLVPILSQVVEPFPNVKIIQGDILDLDPGKLFSNSPHKKRYIVVANIPYYITSAVIRHLLESRPPPRDLYLTVQREVAERICAQPGNYSLLALSIQVYGQPEIAFRIPSGAFYPSPKVDSNLVKVGLYNEPRIPESHLTFFFKLIKAGFLQRRKKLRNSLSAGFGWPVEQAHDLLLQASIEPSRRAETISLEEWARLASLISEIEQKSE
jgi:16S rRNA (adenine1518-N6/adenine1519-N6)-dimethyltransferase